MGRARSFLVNTASARPDSKRYAPLAQRAEEQSRRLEVVRLKANKALAIEGLPITPGAESFSIWKFNLVISSDFVYEITWMGAAAQG
jgi:hypothetical protein